MEEDSQQGWLYIGGVILVFVLIFRILGLTFFSDDIKAYSATCKDEVKLNICNNPEYASNITTYSVNVGQQYVITSAGGYVSKYTKCAIKDRNNWQCSFNDNSGNFGFAEGRYFDFPNYEMVSDFSKKLMEKTYYLSRFEFINLQSKSCEFAYPFCYLFYAILQ